MNEQEKKPIEQLSTFTKELTDDPELFRVVDTTGNWTHYWHQIHGFMPAVNRVLRIGFPMEEGLIQWLKQTPIEESEKLFKSAGERGSKVHAAIRDLVIGVTVHITNRYPNDAGVQEELSIDEWKCLRAFVDWVEVFKPQVKSVESAVYHPRYKFAGTTDFVGKITIPAGQKVYINDKLVTFKKDETIKVSPLDWKTGSRVRNDYKLQVAAYSACLRSNSYTGVVRFGTSHKSGWELKLWSPSQTKFHFKRFLQAKENYNFITGEDSTFVIESEVIPSQLNVKIPIIKGKVKKS